MLACILSFTTGFLSLSIEILWIRLFGYANHSMPQAFAFVLAFYLVGIAVGADIGKRFCREHNNLWFVSGIALTLASICDLCSPWIYVAVAANTHQLLASAALILLSAALKAIVFPIAHHLGTTHTTANLGHKVSTVYVSNIFGSTLGPLVTGFILLGYFTTQQCFIICAALTFCVAVICLSAKTRKSYLAFLSVCAILALGYVSMLDSNLLIEKLSGHTLAVRRIVENQYGIVTTYFVPGNGGDFITGGNVYDGRTNLDPLINSNGINRVLILAALNDHPKNVLMIGLSIGTWLKLISTFPEVANIDVIEINPGYLQAIADYPDHEIGLSDQRVNLYFDDGRRWLKAHPDNKYDLIIMNTTFYWRAYSSNLLSREFLTALKTHMNEHAILSYNTTDSPDAFKTADAVFDHAYLYENFVIAADFDWRQKLFANNAVEKLAQLKMDGKLVFPAKSENVINSFLHLPTRSFQDVETYYDNFGRNIEIITDRNLITEYKYGKQL